MSTPYCCETGGSQGPTVNYLRLKAKTGLFKANTEPHKGLQKGKESTRKSAANSYIKNLAKNSPVGL